jgi:N utilization substance protein B
MDDVQCVISRRNNRILAMQFLYTHEISREHSFELLWSDLLSVLETLDEKYDFAKSLATGVLKNLREIDERLRKMLIHWKFNRLAKVDLAILRLAIYEMIYCESIPHVVTINEAIELGKQYSSDDSKRIINGILDRLRKDQCQIINSNNS